MKPVFCFSLVTAFLFSVLNIVVSFLFRKFQPKEINGFFGYRTARSMGSQAAWNFANHYSAQLLFRCAWAVFLFQFVLYLIFEAAIALLCFVGLWIACLFLTILRTEVMLKRHGF